MNIVNEIVRTYAKYKAPDGVDAENKHPEFWLACLKAEVKEIEDAIAEGSIGHILDELADVAFIGVDSINKMGFAVEPTLRNRLEKNSLKDLSKRDTAYYLAKAGEVV